MVPSDLVLASTESQREPVLPMGRDPKSAAIPFAPLQATSPDPLFGTTDKYKIAVPLLRPEELPDSGAKLV
jgi:hypothetical protein